MFMINALKAAKLQASMMQKVLFLQHHCILSLILLKMCLEITSENTLVPSKY